MSTGKRQFSETLGGFIDAGPGQRAARINVMRIQGVKPQLLEVADAIAYVTQRAYASKGKHGPNDRRFKMLYELVGPEVVALKVGQDGGLGFSVPNTSLTFSPEVAS
jgi:hypothetical protein